MWIHYLLVLWVLQMVPSRFMFIQYSGSVVCCMNPGGNSSRLPSNQNKFPPHGQFYRLLHHHLIMDFAFEGLLFIQSLAIDKQWSKWNGVPIGTSSISIYWIICRPFYLQLFNQTSLLPILQFRLQIWIVWRQSMVLFHRTHNMNLLLQILPCSQPKLDFTAEFYQLW